MRPPDLELVVSAIVIVASVVVSLILVHAARQLDIGNKKRARLLELRIQADLYVMTQQPGLLRETLKQVRALNHPPVGAHPTHRGTPTRERGR